LSVIETPPVDRLAIRTYVTRYDEAVVRDAVLRELGRGGQVFFVHNRVENIDAVARRLAEVVPEARIAVAHGQMAERELERTMLDFMHAKTNLLVSSAIIESGLDIPTANTMIVNRADTFGLAQLYQLRGRIGRSPPSSTRTSSSRRCASCAARPPKRRSSPRSSSASRPSSPRPTSPT